MGVVAKRQDAVAKQGSICEGTKNTQETDTMETSEVIKTEDIETEELKVEENETEQTENEIVTENDAPAVLQERDTRMVLEE